MLGIDVSASGHAYQINDYLLDRWVICFPGDSKRGLQSRHLETACKSRVLGCRSKISDHGYRSDVLEGC
jgi:hypothetical protein